jgi:hypothetical protein
MSIKRLTQEPVSEVAQAKMTALAKHMEQALADAGKEDAGTAKAHMEQLRAEWKEAAETFAAGKPVKTQDVKALGQRMVAALSHIVAGEVKPPVPKLGE